MKNAKHITSFDDMLDKKYGKVGTKKRDQWEQEFESFRIEVMKTSHRSVKTNP